MENVSILPTNRHSSSGSGRRRITSRARCMRHRTGTQPRERKRAIQEYCKAVSSKFTGRAQSATHKSKQIPTVQGGQV
jgi:hypothetical protein